MVFFANQFRCSTTSKIGRNDRSPVLIMNNNTEGPWASGLIRSYSDHAAVLLEHFQQQSRYPDSMKCNRSISNLHNDDHSSIHSKPNYQDETGDSTYRSCFRKLSSAILEEDEKYNQRRNIETGCGDTTALSCEFSELNLTERNSFLGDINGCESRIGFESALLPSTNPDAKMRSSIEVEHGQSNDDEIYNGSEYQLSDRSKSCQDNFDGSNSMVDQAYSSSSSVSTNSRPSRVRKHISYENWVIEKERELQRRRDEARRAEIQRSQAEEHKKIEKEAKQIQEYECFLDWVKKKKQEKILRQELAAKELEFRKQLYEVEKKTQLAKTIDLTQWLKKKEKQQKAIEKAMLMKQKKLQEEKEKRLQNSIKAYEKWCEKAKNAPRPATQGLLPHQKAKPAFTNPTPWKSLVDNDSDHSDITSRSKTSTKIVKNLQCKKNEYQKTKNI